MKTKMFLNLSGSRGMEVEIKRESMPGTRGIRFSISAKKAKYFVFSSDGNDKGLQIGNANDKYETTPFDNFRYNDTGSHLIPSEVWSGYLWKRCGQDNAPCNTKVPTEV